VSAYASSIPSFEPVYAFRSNEYLAIIIDGGNMGIIDGTNRLTAWTKGGSSRRSLVACSNHTTIITARNRVLLSRRPTSPPQYSI